MHTLFSLEDRYGLTIENRAGEISRDDYDKWRYYYPQYDDTQITAKVPSQELSEAMLKALKGNTEG